MNQSLIRKVCGVLLSTGVILLITLAVFVFAEGVVSCYRAARMPIKALLRGGQINSATRYDALLGWAPTPGYSGPANTGGRTTINKQGYRNPREISDNIAPGKRRILCVGDSYSFGEGVADEATWTQQLEQINRQLETVNLGVPGYGIDQMYLRFVQESKKLKYDAIIFSFILEDYYRVFYNSFVGYPKPILNPETIEARNIPVPRRSLLGQMSEVYAASSEKLRLFEQLKLDPRKLFTAKTHEAIAAKQVDKIVSGVISNLHHQARRSGKQLAFVLLPSANTVSGKDETIRNHLTSIFESKSLSLIDLTPEMRKLSSNEVIPLFQNGMDGGHYSVKGNRWAAQVLAEKIPFLKK